LIEVPVLIGLVYVSLWIKKRFYVEPVKAQEVEKKHGESEMVKLDE
jgi:hypothetical protein